MINIKVSFEFGKGVQVLDHVRDRLRNRQALNAAVEIACTLAVKEHLLTHYAGRANALGAPSTGYWKRAIEGTTGTSNATGVDITIRQIGIRLKWEGGTIRASGKTSEVTGKPIRFLTIPVHPAAHGKTIADLGGKGQFYVRPFAGGGGLKEGGDGTGAGVFRKSGGKEGNGDPLYWVLKKFVTIKADKNILPSEAVLEREAREAGQEYLEL